MKVKVEGCWSGGNRYHYRLTLPNGAREIISHGEGDSWDRNMASRALDKLENLHGLKRKNIRFDHH